MPESKDPFHGRDGFNNVKFDEVPDLGRVQKEHAVEAIKRIVRENPGIVGILTNIIVQDVPLGSIL